MMLTPARVASLLAAGAALLAGLAPAIANLDTTSTAGLVGGAFAVVGVLASFLKGQRAHEARSHTWADTTLLGAEDHDDALPAELVDAPADNPATDAIDLPDEH